MGNDPLALSEITAGLPQDAEYDAVYAAVTATERGRWFLAEYASRNRNADTGLVTAALERIEAAIKAVRANEGPPTAVEGSGAANGAPASIAVTPAAHQPSDSASEQDSSAQTDPFDLVWQDDKKIAAAAAVLQASFSSLGDHEPAEADRQSPAVDIASAPPHRPPAYIEPPDFVFVPSTRKPDRDVQAESGEQSVHPLLPGAELLPDPGDDPADLFEATPERGAVAASSAPAEIPESPAAVMPPAQLPTPQLRIAAGSAIRPSPRPAPGNPLAALQVLSEEELVALFG